MPDAYPSLPYEPWKDTKTTLHLMTQIVGKVRLGISPRMNHWWHVPFYVSPRGLTTSTIPHRGESFEMEFDFIDHVLAVRGSRGVTRRVPLRGTSVAGFYEGTAAALVDVNVFPKMLARPFDPAKTGSDIPFAEDTLHTAYDAEAVERFRLALVGIERVFREFRGRFIGKCSPVHFFWHSFDLAVTRFSGRAAPVSADADPVTREAYSHEVISAGFWPGDDASLPEAAFYAYAAPEPAGLAGEPLRPPEARWDTSGTGAMALYLYEDFRTAPDPDAALLEFLQSTYDGAARLAGWPGELLAK